MSNQLKVISPVDGSIYTQRSLADNAMIGKALVTATEAQASWSKTPITERAAICLAMIDALLSKQTQLGEQLSWQMGRPIRYAPAEIRTLAERCRYMIEIATNSLQDIVAEPAIPGVRRFIRREPLGVVLTIAPWNYPYLTAINSIIPAIMAGNAVLLKHSAQTPLCAEAFADAFQAANLPAGVFQYLHLSHTDTQALMKNPAINFVAFTGSVAAGAMVEQTLAGRFIGAGLELGGKDPSYVRHDADLAHAIDNVVEGAFFNSGQCCCGTERVYVHSKLYDQFLDGVIHKVNQLNLGNPLKPETTLGPMVRKTAADEVRGQIQDALAAGATALIDSKRFPADQGNSAYLAPQVLINVDHSMRIMREETFGPAVGIMRVNSDETAIQLMNDSEYGLTASIYSQDAEAGLYLAEQLQTGTCYLNRCDYLDPALAWVGIKNSGRGCSLSPVGYEQLTRPKSFYLQS